MEDKEATCKYESVMSSGDTEVLVEKLDRRRKRKFKPQNLRKEQDNKDNICSSIINSSNKEEVPNHKDNICSEEADKLSKKLYLSNDQFKLLETRFNEQNIPSSEEKQELANQTHLSAKQVEVWFEIRTKNKRMREECEFMLRRCGTLLEDNERLKKELSKLRKSKKLKSSFCIDTPCEEP